jgi:hypothetical protein
MFALILLYDISFIGVLGYAIPLEVSKKWKKPLRLIFIVLLLAVPTYFFFGDRKYNFNFEYLDLDEDGINDYRYRVIDMHAGTSGVSEIWKIKFYNMNSLKVIGIEVYSHTGKWDNYDTFEPWDYGMKAYEDRPLDGANNWMNLEGTEGY